MTMTPCACHTPTEDPAPATCSLAPEWESEIQRLPGRVTCGNKTDMNTSRTRECQASEKWRYLNVYISVTALAGGF